MAIFHTWRICPYLYILLWKSENAPHPPGETTENAEAWESQLLEGFEFSWTCNLSRGNICSWNSTHIKAILQTFHPTCRYWRNFHYWLHRMRPNYCNVNNCSGMNISKFPENCCSRQLLFKTIIVQRLCSSLPRVGRCIGRVPILPGFVALSDKNEENMPSTSGHGCYNEAVKIVFMAIPQDFSFPVTLLSVVSSVITVLQAVVSCSRLELQASCK